MIARLSACIARGRRPETDPPLAPDDVAELVEPGVHPVRGRPGRGAGRRALVAERRRQADLEQYDAYVQGQTVASAGFDAAVIRVPGTLKGLALSSDGKGRFGHLDPYLGAAHAVAEAARNVAATGATPLAITNCMNFGNPERPVVMWQFAEAIRGMRDACLAFDTPVTGGKLKLYNESGDSAIWPTPVIGMLGLLERLPAAGADGVRARGAVDRRPGREFAELGRVGVRRRRARRDRGPSPGAAIWSASERSSTCCTRRRAATVLAAAPDCSDGGLAVALAEQAILSGQWVRGRRAG